MKYCQHCDVKVSDFHKRCPLCQSPLTYDGEKTAKKVPYMPSYSTFEEQQTNSVIASVRLILLIVGIFSVFLNYRRPKAGFWSLIILVTFVSFWWWLSIAVKIRKSKIKKFSQMVFIEVTVAVFLDYMFGWNKWSLNYVVPILITSAIIIIMAADKIFKISGAERVFYTFLLVILGLVFTGFIMVDVITFNIPSYILLFICIFSICHSLIFERHELVNELQKRFHI